MKRLNECGSSTLFRLPAALCVGAIACEPAGEGGGDSRAADASQVASESAQAPAEPWTLEDVTPDVDDGIRELIIHDAVAVVRRFHGYR